MARTCDLHISLDSCFFLTFFFVRQFGNFVSVFFFFLIVDNSLQKCLLPMKRQDSHQLHRIIDLCSDMTEIMLFLLLLFFRGMIKCFDQ